ncbi:c-type cytochrome [Chryseosolibacter indicus]|uniref:C-type cytochrome n=1 Tax=Chryseosolibacter indicus TaxID=2782351 RepID=A0ABS5VKA3_9BACT|nr:c-type cytochrome [Chryseosolibacter indicus]MBT1701811.1 c-type cytochrome [Chryseosolibacter indicus]
MKKFFILIVLVGFSTWTLTSCGGGGKKEEGKTEEGAGDEYSDYETAEPKKESAEDLIKQGQALVDQSDCKTCHHATNKIVGPAHAEVAKKYEFTPANVSMLAGKIIQGGSGNWGDIPMTPHPDISKADAEKMAMYVLSLDGEKPKQ